MRHILSKIKLTYRAEKGVNIKAWLTKSKRTYPTEAKLGSLSNSLHGSPEDQTFDQTERTPLLRNSITGGSL